MLDLKVNGLFNTDKLNNNFAPKGYNEDNKAFSKVFEDANKSFEATKEAIEKQENKEDNFFKKIKDQFSKNNNENETTKDEETKKDDTAQENQTTTNLEQILLDYKNNLANKHSQISEKSVENSQELRETSERLLHQKEQALEMTAKLMSELKNAQNKINTQNPIKTNTGEVQSQLLNTNKEVILSGEAATNLQNLANIKTTDNSSLADALAELDIEVTSVKVDTSAQTEAKGFDFNSSSFSNLNSHITKLSLNKTVDFSKVMGEKISQEQQILNQIKEGTQSQLSKGSSSVNIILRPEHLGKVNVNIVSNNGVVSAQFTAQSQQAADALNKNIDTLKQNLIDQGLKISEVSVRVQETSQGETFSDARNFDGDKLGQSKENNSNKNSYKSEHSNNNSEINQAYLENDEQEEDAQEQTSNIKNNNNLEIYNNMGRTL